MKTDRYGMEFWNNLVLWSVKERLTSKWAAYKLHQQIRNERNDLADLPDELLVDIGITRMQADNESKRTWHDIPMERQQEHRQTDGCRSGACTDRIFTA